MNNARAAKLVCALALSYRCVHGFVLPLGAPLGYKAVSAKSSLRMVAAERQAAVASAVMNSAVQHSTERKHVEIYDTTLRDGTQMEGISVSVDDKLKIAKELSNFGMHYIEGGWPGSNPKDAEFFARARAELPAEAWSRVVAFGSTRRKHGTCAADTQLAALIAAGTSCVTIVAKAWDLHVDSILEVSREENLAMVSESVSHLKAAGKEVMLDLEHFFDGYKANPVYTMEVCSKAVEADVDVLVLCDTNGGSLPWEIDEIVRAVKEAFPAVRLGIHCHNDQELAVCNSVQAVRSGVTVVQGTVNGIGERTGNANLVSIIPTLQLKMGYTGVGPALSNLTALSRYTDEQLNRVPDAKAPYVGQSAFAHKGGIHVSAVNKIPGSYQHIEPADVGNVRRTLVSELSGRSNILSKVEEFGMGSKDDFNTPIWKDRMGHVLETVKNLEKRGYTFEGADATVNLMIRRLMSGYTAPFRLVDFTVTTGDTFRLEGVSEARVGLGGAMTRARATVKVKLPEGVKQPLSALWDSGDHTERLESAEGNGPVNALAKALYKALLPYFPTLQHVVLKDYKVRILDQASATAAKTRVMIEFYDGFHNQQWATVGVDSNIISASMCALLDGFEYALVEYATTCHLDTPRPSLAAADDMLANTTYKEISAENLAAAASAQL